jgi:hypothetical protein
MQRCQVKFSVKLIEIFFKNNLNNSALPDRFLKIFKMI